MPISRLLWGANYENALQLGLPLLGILTDREERAGSTHDFDGAGNAVAWIEGRDYVMQCEARRIPDRPTTSPVQTALSGAAGWQDFLDWARAGNPLRFVPDVTNPLFYLDNTYLVEPVTDSTSTGVQGFGTLSSTIQRNVTLKLRNATMDFHKALRGIMFEYVPGTDISATGLGLASSLAAGKFVDIAGIVQLAAASVLRDRHYDAARRVALFEEARTNLILQSEDLRTNGEGNPTVAWAANNTTITINATTAPDGNVTADKLVETAVTNFHGRQQGITIIAGNVVVVSGFFKAAERTQGQIGAFNGADSISAFFDTAGSGTITPIVGGSGTSKLARIVAIGNGWWYVWMSGIVNAGSTAITCTWQLGSGGLGSYLGTLTQGAYYWGCQGEQVSVTAGAGQFCPAFYIPTTTVTVARASDVALKAWPWQKQPMWVYVKFIENGVAFSPAPGGALPDLVAIGNFGANLRTEMTGGSPGYGFSHGNNLTTRASNINLSPAVGDVIELLGIIYGDDSVQLFGRKNGGSTTAGSQSAAGVATPPYVYLNLQIGGEGGNAQGVVELQALKVGAGASVITIPAAIAA